MTRRRKFVHAIFGHASPCMKRLRVECSLQSPTRSSAPPVHHISHRYPHRRARPRRRPHLDPRHRRRCTGPKQGRRRNSALRTALRRMPRPGFGEGTGPARCQPQPEYRALSILCVARPCSRRRRSGIRPQGPLLLSRRRGQGAICQFF